MAHASYNPNQASSIFRLDLPEKLDLDAIEATAAKTQRSAWRYLLNIFDSAHTRHCRQFSLEPDATLWRLRYHMIEGFEEHIISDPSIIIWALEALQIALWGDDYRKKPNRADRFVCSRNNKSVLITLQVLDTVNGDSLQFDMEEINAMPPTLDEIGLEIKQLQDVRYILKQQKGMLLVTSSDQHFLDDTLLAINQELISPDRKILSISERHRYSLPRTSQIDLHACNPNEREHTWKSALDTFHNVLLGSAHVPEHFQEQISDRCDQGTLSVQSLRVSRAADAIDLLNAGILRRAPMHRAVTSVLSHFPVESICQNCADNSSLSDEEQAWLEQLRTPATENVVSWLVDGNTEQFLEGKGCEVCAETGCGKPLSVFNLLHRDDKSNQFPVPSAVNVSITNSGKTNSGKLHSPSSMSMQRQLMNLAKAGRIPLSEVIRVMRSI